MNDLDNNGVELDEELDVEDVAAAMNQRAVEEHVSTGNIRAAYYGAYCFLRDFEDAGRDLKDERLSSLARDALNTLDHIHDRLEDKYKWD